DSPTRRREVEPAVDGETTFEVEQRRAGVELVEFHGDRAALDELRVQEAQELVGGGVEVALGSRLVGKRVADPDEGVEQFVIEQVVDHGDPLSSDGQTARGPCEDSTEDSTR